MAQLVQRFGHDPLAGPFFNGVLQGEIFGLPAVVQMAEKLSMSEAELASYEVTAEGFTPESPKILYARLHGVERRRERATG